MTSLDNDRMEHTPSRNEGRKPGLYGWIAIALGLLLVGAVALWLTRESQLRQRDRALKTAYRQLDSIGTEMDRKMVEIERLGGDIEELHLIRDSLEAEKTELFEANRYTERQLRATRERVEGYRELLVMKDVEIEELKKLNENLVSENIELKTERNELNQTLRQAQQTQQQLTQKVELASRLVAENIRISASTGGSKPREGEFRARQVEKLTVEFQIGKNDVAPIEGKEILMRIIDENDNVLFDVARGSGTFRLGGKETFYTAKQEILFDNTAQKVTFNYEKGSEYVPGLYNMEIYTDGYLMGNKTFRVK
jgi:hypothetical protein